MYAPCRSLGRTLTTESTFQMTRAQTWWQKASRLERAAVMLLLGAVCLLPLTIIALIGIAVHLDHRVAVEMERQKGLGLPTSAAEYQALRTPVAPDRNAALPLREAALLLEKCGVTDLLKDWRLSPDEYADWPASQREMLQAFRRGTECRDIQQHIDQAAALPECRFERDWFDHDQDCRGPTEDVQPIVSLLHVLAMDDAQNGQPEAAAGKLATALRITGLLSEEPALICMLFAENLDATTLRVAAKLAAQDTFADAHLAVIQTALDSRPPFHPATWYLQADRTHTISVFAHIETKKPSIIGNYKVFIQYSPLRILLQADHVAYLDAMRKLETFAEKPYSPGLLQQQQTITSGVPSYAFFSRMLTFSIRDTMVPPLRHAAALAVLHTGIAVERHRRATGNYPARLEDISKELLPTLPIDPFSAQPPIYRTKNNRLTLLSVGPNMVDNSGDQESDDVAWGKTAAAPAACPVRIR